MAVTQKVYSKLFSKPEGRILIKKEHLQIVVFDPQTEEIKQWIP